MHQSHLPCIFALLVSLAHCIQQISIRDIRDDRIIDPETGRSYVSTGVWSLDQPNEKSTIPITSNSYRRLSLSYSDESMEEYADPTDRYQLRALLGFGSSGEVHSAIDQLTKQPVAIKMLPIRNNYGMQRLEEEIRIMRLASSHPNIVQFHTAFVIARPLSSKDSWKWRRLSSASTFQHKRASKIRKPLDQDESDESSDNDDSIRIEEVTASMSIDDQNPVASSQPRKQKYQPIKYSGTVSNSNSSSESNSYDRIFNQPKYNQVWIVMELVSSGNLEEAIRRGPHFSEIRIRKIVRQMVQALDYLHSMGIAHRDIKSANVMLTANDKVKIVDFGFGVILESQQDISRHSFVGTPYTMAPEIIKRQEFDPCKSDIWAVGILIYEMFEGRTPYGEAKHSLNRYFDRIASGPELKLSEIIRKPSDSLKSFFALCMRADPSTRPAAAELLEHEFLRINSDK